MEGAAQMAAMGISRSRQKSIAPCTTGLFSKLRVPGSPPGRTIISNFSPGEKALSARSQRTVTPWELVISRPPMPTVRTSFLARRRVSTGARASVCSNPSAKNTAIIARNLHSRPPKGGRFPAGQS